MIKLPQLPDPRTREGVKTIARFVVARAASVTIVTLIKQNVDTEELAAHNKAGVVIGAHVLGEMVADATKAHVDRQIDEMADVLAELKKAKDEQLQDPIKVDATRE